MTVNLLLFAAAADLAGTGSARLEMPDGPPPTAAAVRALIAERYPALAPLMASCALAVDGAYAAAGITVRDGAEVAVIPPVSGGSGDVGGPAAAPAAVTDAPILLDALAARNAVLARDGGHAWFVGTVRGVTDGRVTTRLEYSCYRPMAERLIRDICARAEAGAADVRVVAQHRVGTLRPGDVAVAVCAAAPHRDAAFAACRLAIEAIKREVPIWKREYGPDGARWVEGTHAEPAAPDAAAALSPEARPRP